MINATMRKNVKLYDHFTELAHTFTYSKFYEYINKNNIDVIFFNPGEKKDINLIKKRIKNLEYHGYSVDNVVDAESLFPKVAFI